MVRTTGIYPRKPRTPGERGGLRVVVWKDQGKTMKHLGTFYDEAEAIRVREQFIRENPEYGGKR